jgi:flagellar biosynthesis protein FliQ
MKEEKPKSQPQTQSNRMRIGLLLASLIVGVIIALFSILTTPH